tara:strand:+ start:64087 stop:64356 length:270 start_codon:yes stop_codon:yes gene_type:complete
MKWIAAEFSIVTTIKNVFSITGEISARKENDVNVIINVITIIDSNTPIPLALLISVFSITYLSSITLKANVIKTLAQIVKLLAFIVSNL